MALPALRLLAEHGLDLRFVGKSWAPSLLHAFGGACEQLANGQKAGSQQLRDIKADGFAQIMLMTHSCSSAAMAWRAGVRAIGYAKDWRGPLLHQRLAWPKEQHEVLRYWQLAEATLAWLGVPYNRPSLEDWQPPWRELTASEAQLAAGAAALQGAGLNEQESISLICPVATGTVKGMDKQWPHFQAFASLWHDDAGTQGKTLAVVAPPGKENEIAEQFPQLPMLSKLSMDAFIGVLAQVQLVIANDSGPMHLACALGTKALVPFGAGITYPERTGAWSPHLIPLTGGKPWPSAVQALETIQTTQATPGP